MTAPFKYPGGKWSYADWLVSLAAPHRFYLEPFFGSGAFFFTKKPTIYETINDKDYMIVNFYKACRDYPEELARVIDLTPYAKAEYLSIREEASGQEIKLTGDCVEDARRWAIRCCQGFGPKLAEKSGWSANRHSGGRSFPKTWSKLPNTIYQIAQRLKNVQIECMDAVKLIRACNASDCLIYADPPYLGETRTGKLYREEMMDRESHNRILDALMDHKGPVMLSGYDNDLYNERLKGWRKQTKKGYTTGGNKRLETVWLNYDIPQQMRL